MPAWSKAEFRPMRLANCLRANRPKVRAATAGPKTSPTIAIRLLANKTGQKLGHAKMMMAATLSTARAKTIAPRLARVRVDRGADRRLEYEPEQTTDCSHHSDLGLAPMLLGDQEHIEIRPHRAADIGEQKVDRVEQKRIEILSLG
jgi:hypothetical protein